MEQSNFAASPAAEAAACAGQGQRARAIDHILRILHDWGIHTLGQLASLNRDDLVARLGPVAIELWERATGRAERVLKLVSPPESFVESFEFETEIESIEPLLFILRRFLQQLAIRLNAIYLVASDLRLRISFSDKSNHERVFKIPQPTNNEQVLFRMLHTHLENFRSHHPIVAVELEARPSKPARQQFALFETALRDPAQLHETLARLTALLGTDRVGTPVLEQTHQPDAFRVEPFRWEFAHADPSEELTFCKGTPSSREHSNSSPSVQDNSGIPLRRFRLGAKATVFLERHQPIHLQAPQLQGSIIAHNGPFSLSGNWWDERGWDRVEWDVELDNGTIARCHCDENGWAVDGVYD